MLFLSCPSSQWDSLRTRNKSTPLQPLIVVSSTEVSAWAIGGSCFFWYHIKTIKTMWYEWYVTEFRNAGTFYGILVSKNDQSNYRALFLVSRTLGTRQRCTFLMGRWWYVCGTVRVGWGGVGGLITIKYTSTHTSCYATARSSCTSTHTSCYATARFSCTCTHTSCYATAGFSCTCTHARHATKGHTSPR